MSEQAKKLPYWDKLTDGEREQVYQNTTVRTFEKGAFLKGRGEACLGMIYILSGALRALMISDEGREITLFRLGAGDSCVLSASCVLSRISFETELTAAEKTEVLIVNAGTFAQLMGENTEVRCFGYELAAARSSAVISVLQQIIFSSFDRRLAGFLLAECERTGGDEIKMSKESIAREVNTAREVVSRMLRRFADGGLIAMNQKTIKVTDREGLRKIL